MIWQWTQTGTLNGVRGEVDRNAFYGDIDDWTVFLLSGCDPRAVQTLGGAQKGKAIIVLNPVEPTMIMRDTLFC